MSSKATRLTIDGISYELTDQGARKITNMPKRSTTPKKKSASTVVVKQPLKVTAPVVVVTTLRMLCSLRFIVVLLAPIVMLVIAKTIQLNSYELAQTATNWFSISNLNTLRYILAGIGIVVVIGWLLEPWLLKLFSPSRPPYWQLMGGLIAGTAYYVLLMALSTIASTGITVLIISKLYSFLPVLAVFMIILLWLVTIIGWLWCWARRNRSVLRHARSTKVAKLVLVPILVDAGPVATAAKTINRLLPATITLIILALVISFETLLFLSGLSSGWQALGLVVGVCLSVVLLSFDHLQKHRYWLTDIDRFTQLRRYPALAMTILGIDSILLASVLVGITVQIVLPQAFEVAHTQSVRLKKIIEQSNLVIPSAKQVQPFDNNTKNK